MAMRMLDVPNRDIEKRLGVSPSYLSRLFSGAIDLKMDHILEIVDAIGLEPADFFHLAYPRRPDPGTTKAQQLRKTLRDLQPPESDSRRAPGPTQEEIDEMMRKSLRRLLDEVGKPGLS
jgi:transcriptional regulator with XRE-family HTH domain